VIHQRIVQRRRGRRGAAVRAPAAVWEPTAAGPAAAVRAPGAAVRAAAPALRGRRGRGRRCGTYRGTASDGLQRASDAVCEAEQHLTAAVTRLHPDLITVTVTMTVILERWDTRAAYVEHTCGRRSFIPRTDV